ncbi:hypothetical protein [Pseudomaricurvus albidus]|nr:hypothetical protein [Aestuariicella albida]
MVEHVLVGTLGATLSMAAILVAGLAGGLLLIWLDSHTDHGEEH